LVVNGKPLDATFGTEGAQWHWQDGGKVEIVERRARIALHDLTGFEGRCDAVLFASDPQFAQFYRSLEAYRASFRNKTDMMVVDPSSDFFKAMRGSGAGTPAAPKR
jgi:hypothetical protein